MKNNNALSKSLGSRCLSETIVECRRVIDASTADDLLRRESSSWDEEDTKAVAESWRSFTCSTIRLTSSSTSIVSDDIGLCMSGRGREAELERERFCRDAERQNKRLGLI